MQLHGGLGNQMFQAAAGIALARRHFPEDGKIDGRLIFDLSRFRARGLRAYALAPFGLEAEIRSEGPALSARLTRALTRITGRKRLAIPAWWHGVHYREPHFHFDPAFEQLSGDLLIVGYFQSPRYFSGAEDAIRVAFAPEKLAGGAGSLAARLAGEDSVAIHVRRGDYSVDPRAATVHGVLGWEYYDTAVAYVRERVPAARLFVFSDNHAAAAEAAARWPGAEALAGQVAGEDLYLMSCCRHHIVANSSFSWWSAWLDGRGGGIRIAPRAWFTPAASATRDTRDLIPANWVRL